MCKDSSCLLSVSPNLHIGKDETSQHLTYRSSYDDAHANLHNSLSAIMAYNGKGLPKAGE